MWIFDVPLYRQKDIKLFVSKNVRWRFFTILYMLSVVIIYLFVSSKTTIASIIQQVYLGLTVIVVLYFGFRNGLKFIVFFPAPIMLTYFLMFSKIDTAQISLINLIWSPLPYAGLMSNVIDSYLSSRAIKQMGFRTGKVKM